MLISSLRVIPLALRDLASIQEPHLRSISARPSATLYLVHAYIYFYFPLGQPSATLLVQPGRSAPLNTHCL
jgi:hypothetical protein